MLEPGVYEDLITQALAAQLDGVSDDRVLSEPLDDAEAHHRLARFLAEAVRDRLQGVEGRAERREVVEGLLGWLAGQRDDSLADFWPLADDDDRYRLLSEILPTDRRVPLERPSTPMDTASLLVGGDGPALFRELQAEIETAERVDILCSFVRWSGVQLLMRSLEKLTAEPTSDGTPRLRVLTTSYMGVTQVRAVAALAGLRNTAVRVAYDPDRTRLHAKAYLFSRPRQLSSAYIGSANLSRSAMHEGLEWNVKVTARDSPQVIVATEAAFARHWDSGEFEAYDGAKLREALRLTREHPERSAFYLDVRPLPHQEVILERLAAERRVHDRWRNLVVAATGTGKTVVAALDYRRFREQEPRARLLYVAHRLEILKQGMATFRQVLRDGNFGELESGSHEAGHFEHLFVSIQTAQSRALCERLAADYYDYIVIDEFHRAGAPSYDDILAHFKPKVLLGLTATPERTDGADIVGRYFDGRFAVELRLPEAIQQELLVPFHYFGVTDPVNYADLEWKVGGYMHRQLEERILSAGPVRDQVVTQELRRLADVETMRALVFCVSRVHAERTARALQEDGIPAVALDGRADEAQRTAARRGLELPRTDPDHIKALCVVDLYNEGIDIPGIDTLLFLRPTESALLFTQQLGRGLRRADGKDSVTVLDFIGDAHRNFRFANRFAVLTGRPSTVQRDVEHDFPVLPGGCAIQLQPVARDRVLQNLRQSWTPRSFAPRLRDLADELRRPPSLREYLDAYDLALSDVYTGVRTWTQLCVEAGIRVPSKDRDSAAFASIIARFTHVDDPDRLRSYVSILGGKTAWGYEPDLMLTSMFFPARGLPASPATMQTFLEANPDHVSELLDLLGVLTDDILFEADIEPYKATPLHVHARYRRSEVLAGLGRWQWGEYPPSREGVLWLPDDRTDVFFVTLRKSEKDYSPLTQYDDYIASATVMHWQSQHTTSEESVTGRRYVNHIAGGSSVLLFVRRDRRDENGHAQPFYCLGEMEYQSHRGSRPMSITWRMLQPIPAHIRQALE